MKLKYLQPNTSKALIDRQKASTLRRRAAVLKHAHLEKQRDTAEHQVWIHSLLITRFYKLGQIKNTFCAYDMK